jgi:hypothetical protein
MPEDSVETSGTVSVENVAGHSQRGERSLAMRYRRVAPGRVARVGTPTFIPSREVAAYFERRGYALLASPTLYAGQTVRVGVAADERNSMPVVCRLYVRTYGPDDELVRAHGPEVVLTPGAEHECEWRIPDMGGTPIADIGVEISSDRRADGTVYLDYLTWEGAPDVVLTRPETARPETGGTMWRRAWVNGVDDYNPRYPEPFRLVHNRGTGLLIQGTREWADYRVSADVTPHMVTAAGIGARVQGLRRYYALLLCNGDKARLVKALDGDAVLAETDFSWRFDETHELSLEVVGDRQGGVRLRAWIDGYLTFEVQDTDRPLDGGGVALICAEGRTATQAVTVRPAE